MGSNGFARHYSRHRYLLSFPRPTKMFQFRRFPFNYPIYSGNDAHDMTHGGFPHSEIPGSKLVCQLPEAYRRLPRPSSPVIAKASTICAYSLDHITPNRLAVSCRSTRHRSHLELHGAGFIANATYPDPAHGPITRPCGGIHLRQALRI